MNWEFEKNIYINCPYKKAYIKEVLRPLVFTVIYFDFNPLLPILINNAFVSRVEKISELICSSKLSIHDLSTIKSRKVDEIYKLNIPFELGLDMGCRNFKSGQWQLKTSLFLQADKNSHFKGLSDLSGYEVLSHKNESRRVIRHVYNWLENYSQGNFIGPTGVYNLFTDYLFENKSTLAKQNFTSKDISNVSMSFLIHDMNYWLSTWKMNR